MTADDFTSPEHYARRREAKRYMAAIKKRGICSACVHREQTLGIHHCKGRPDRSGGACERDGRQPKFHFDAEVLVEFSDAA